MSTRWYPIYQKGAPQLRVFLPNFWMKVIRPTEIQPENVVTFSCSMEMTKYDVKNYLEKIYSVPVVDVRTRIAMGPTKRDQVYGYVTKADDIKIAYVTLVRSWKNPVYFYSKNVFFSFCSPRKQNLCFRISSHKRLKKRKLKMTNHSKNQRKISRNILIETKEGLARQDGFPFRLFFMLS